MKTAIYLRTSTKDQHPEKQEQECMTFAKARGYIIEGIYHEKLSGYKDILRPQYDLIKDKAYRGEIQSVIVWALDRWVRNRDTLLEDVTSLRSYGCKLHSVKEKWLEAINIEGSLGRTVQEFLLGLLGSIAEMESQRKSERMIMAYKNHKGKKWGKPSLPKEIVDKVLLMKEQGLSIRQIAKDAYYWDDSNNKKFISKSAVHKIIKQNQTNNSIES